MAIFQEYVGIHYSGRRGPTDPLPGLRVFVAQEDHTPWQERGPDDAAGRWSRRQLAEWLRDRLERPEARIVGIDHAFSFPRTYMERHSLVTWDQFLEDFCEHWPTHEAPVRQLLPGNPRTGEEDELRLAGRWTAFPKSPFRFGRDGLARATHAGLPWLAYLRRLGDRVHFWPFDGWEVPKGRSVVAEVRPARLVNRYAREGLGVEEQAAYAICAWLQERDRLGLLGTYFSPPLSPAERDQARLEGWVLGVA